MGNLIEGAFEPGQKVIVIEDLISTGGSSIKAVESLKEAGLIVKGLAAIFTYGFKQASENFKNADCPFITLTDYSVLIEQALNSNYVTESDLAPLQNWRESPSTWKQNN